MRAIEKLECVRECKVGDILTYGETFIPANMGGECDLVYGLGDKSFVWLPEGTLLSVVDSPEKTYIAKYRKGNPRNARRNATVWAMWNHDATNGYTDVYLYLVDKEMNKLEFSYLKEFKYKVENIPSQSSRTLNAFQKLIKILGFRNYRN